METAKTKKFGPTRDGLRCYLPTGVYHINIKIYGRTIQETTGTANRKAAGIILAAKEAEIRAINPTADAKGKGKATFSDIIEEFLLHVDADNLSQKTKDKRRHLLASFLRSWAKTPEIAAADKGAFKELRPKEVTERDMLAWRKAFLSEFGGDYFNKTLSLVRKLFDLARRNYKFYDRDPTAEIKWAAVRQSELQLPSREQFERLIASFEQYKCFGGTAWKRAKDCRDLVEGLAYTGLRKEEASLLRARHVDLSEGLIRLPAEIVKNRRNARTVPIIERAKPLFERLVKESEKREGAIFAVHECQKTMDKLCEAVGCPRITHHDLRHYFASLALHFTKDPKLVAKWLGHSDGGVLVMRVYAHVFSKHEEEAVKAMKF